MKICSDRRWCKNNEPQPLENFHLNRCKPDGHRSECKICCREKAREKKKSRPEAKCVGRDYNNRCYEIARCSEPAYKGRFFYGSEFRKMLECGYAIPLGTIVLHNDRRYGVCGDGLAWLEFKKAGYPLDARMPPMRLREL